MYFLDGLISGLVIIQFRDICCCILDACLPEKSEKDFIQQKIMFRQVEWFLARLKSIFSNFLLFWKINVFVQKIWLRAKKVTKKEMQLNNSYYPVGVSSWGLDPKSGRMRGTVAKTLLVESVPFPGFWGVESKIKIWVSFRRLGFVDWDCWKWSTNIRRIFSFSSKDKSRRLWTKRRL